MSPRRSNVNAKSGTIYRARFDCSVKYTSHLLFALNILNILIPEWDIFNESAMMRVRKIDGRAGFMRLTRLEIYYLNASHYRWKLTSAFCAIFAHTFAYTYSIFQLNSYIAAGLHLMYHPRTIVTKVNFKIEVSGLVPQRTPILICTRWHAIVCLPAFVISSKRSRANPRSKLLTICTV